MFNSASKRQKEMARKERGKEKEERARQRAAEKAARAAATPDGVDPDIAHIVPGPQPVLEE